MIRRVLAAVWVETLLAVALGWAVVEITLPGVRLAAPSASTGARVMDVLTALGVVGLLLALPAIDLLARQPRLIVNSLPGLPSTRPRPSRRLLRVGAGAVLLVVVTGLGLGWSPLALVLVVITDVGLGIVLIRLRAELKGRPSRRAALSAALAVYRPRFVVYTARRNDGSYQLAMWLPQLDKLGEPYLVVVRHQEAIAHARTLSTAPVICCPAGADLDALVVPSLRAAFYVNGVSENTNFVLYRQLRHVYLGHGDSDKEMSVHPMHAMFDHVFVAGRAAIDRYDQSGVRIDHALFTVVGRPQLTESTGPALRPGATTRVLLAPTWRGYNAVSSVSSLPVAAAVAAALVSAGVEVTFRPHPFSWLGAEQTQIEAVDSLLRADRSATGRAHRLAVENRRVALSANFVESDALITDVGSVLVDYFATGKPYAVVLPAGVDPANAPALYPSTSAAHRISATVFEGSPDSAAMRTAAGDSAAGDSAAGDSTAGDSTAGDSTAGDPQAGDLASTYPEGAGRRRAIDDWIDRLTHPDGLDEQRAAVCRYFLGERPGDDRPFLDAVRTVLDQPPRPAPGRRAGSADPGTSGRPATVLAAGTSVGPGAAAHPSAGPAAAAQPTVGTGGPRSRGNVSDVSDVDPDASTPVEPTLERVPAHERAGEGSG